MLEVYCLKLDKKINENMYNQMSYYISNDKIVRINKIKRLKDRIPHLVGDILVRYLIHIKLGIPNDRIEFKYNENGKPSFLNFENFHFNLSHSGEYVVCAIDDCDIGIDVEKIKEIDLSIVRVVFTDHEIWKLEKEVIENRQRLFYSIWTLKESFVKKIGVGLTFPLKKIEIQQKDQLTFLHNNKIHYFYQTNVDHEHILSVCSGNPISNCPIKHIDVMELYNWVTNNHIYLAKQ